MTLDAAIETLDVVINVMETRLPEISEEMAMDSTALIINRIQQEGLEGRKYSTTPLPVFYYEGRENNAGGRALINKKRKENEGISYEEWRVANGLQVGHVDLTFTGRMWQNVGILGTTEINGMVVTVVGGFDKEVKDKLRWNAQRFGDFFTVNEEEKQLLTDIYKDKMLQELKNAGLI